MSRELKLNMMANAATVDFLPSVTSAYKPSELTLNASRHGNLQTKPERFSKLGLTVSVLLHLLVLYLFLALQSKPTPDVIKEVPITVSLLSEIPEAPIVENQHKEEVKPEVKQPQPKIKPVKPQKTEQVVATPQPMVSDLPMPTVASEQVAEAKASPAEQAEPVEVKAAQVADKPAQKPKEDVTEPPKFGVAYLNNPKPKYPSLSRRAGEVGRILLKVLVNANGEPESVEISSSSGFERLDTAALEAVKQWRFVPARRNNEAISAYVTVPISFKLD